jgi:hypothetical protein
MESLECVVFVLVRMSAHKRICMCVMRESNFEISRDGLVEE